eukprot:CAMPEP_0168624608 /NCGR_PEP_ID=MMETSP0449_2-20121227/9516_1 /TAXON_ID=1082188 /ORGANISM="Strombidium rassoulzadegani, Strain ras09" /LENGTH=51 /DNA_ID=CAMNT_0008666201 /DNA_START=651 /DNA_END=806 /DNA_ORIENTATION=-
MNLPTGSSFLNNRNSGLSANQGIATMDSQTNILPSAQNNFSHLFNANNAGN